MSDLGPVHPAVQAILPFFEYDHLPDLRLRAVSQPFHDLAHILVRDTGLDLQGPELTVALRKLLEAKDCAVRAAL